MKKIKINGIDIIFTKRKKQKNICLKINSKGEVILSAPFFCSESKAIDFINKNIEWIKNNHLKIPQPTKFKESDTISILGQSYTIVHMPKQKTSVEISNNQLLVGGENTFIHRRVSNFAKKQLLIYIEKKAIELAKIIQKKPNKISLKDTSSRWGSCSSKQNLNFCWKIVFAPIFVIDYLIAHEVAHLKEMNHSDAFYKTVALLNVEQSKAEIWLRKNGKDLINIQ